ncbi:putative Late nodulin [Medicago truncatula]|uniref:Nodule Cysteine-Rich (NCR) secreted peptide n=1 Tax=Medicago truncatula TaxID=3880 RepID=A0A072TVW8_MEDTR|nr:Nodule Cysteine-Rich (NCR) secreted peptide [Medicago truncatula]RHN44121.1 putative Late nodulin [Medicago truncatula]
MARIFNLIYVMVLFLSLFIILTNGDVKCDTDDDCRDYLCARPTVGKCIYDYCHCIVMITIDEKLSHQSGINKVVRENGHVSIDPTIKEIKLRENIL